MGVLGVVAVHCCYCRVVVFVSIGLSIVINLGLPSSPAAVSATHRCVIFRQLTVYTMKLDASRTKRVSGGRDEILPDSTVLRRKTRAKRLDVEQTHESESTT
jgi:hypothetical protein